jgi:hypothetical protein
MSAHTPGPRCPNCDRPLIRGTSVVGGEAMECPLHAAAPSLLEALEEMVIYAEGVPGEGFAKARAAIALARGGESA